MILSLTKPTGLVPGNSAICPLRLSVENYSDRVSFPDLYRGNHGKQPVDANRGCPTIEMLRGGWAEGRLGRRGGQMEGRRERRRKWTWNEGKWQR
jgi:hypothetical protein